MFRAKLLLALSLLGLMALIEGGVALWAQRTALHQVQRGRLTSDILKGYVELSANKQRLRSWAAQQLLAADAPQATRESLLDDMRRGLAQLHELSSQLDALETSLDEPGRREERQHSLDVLERHVQDLAIALERTTPLPKTADASLAWQQLRSLFDERQGLDLRRLLNAEIQAERGATEASRAAADRALSDMRQGVLALSLAALLLTITLALYFMLQLRRPISELMRGVLALREGNLAHRIPERHLDEFGEVARSFNAMAGELQQRRTQEQADRALLEDMVQSRTAELREALDTLQAVDARRRQFFAEVSHELRTPATAIRGEAEVAMRGRDKNPDEYRQAFARIVGTVEEFSHVLADLALLARSEVEQLALEFEPLDWQALLQSCCEQAEVLARAAGLGFTWEIHPAGPGEGLMRGDAKRLRQLLGIVLDNARRYSRPGGEIHLRAAVQQGQLEILLQDQGIGISAQDLPRVFERHFRSNEARSHRPDGLGLGLPIARSIARAHEGELQLSSEAGQGCRVCMRLPLAISEGAA